MNLMSPMKPTIPRHGFVAEAAPLLLWAQEALEAAESAAAVPQPRPAAGAADSAPQRALPTAMNKTQRKKLRLQVRRLVLMPSTGPRFCSCPLVF
jgi:hypothetical protein